MSEWTQEIRYSLRTLLKTPGFTLVAVLSLALGIGINTAVLAVARAVLSQPLPVANAGQLGVAYWWRGDKVSGMQFGSGGMTDEKTGRSLSSNYTYRTYMGLREAVRDRADVFAFAFLRQMNASLEGRPAVGGGMLVSGNYFGAMGVRLHIGRGIEERDDRADAEPVAVIGYGLWQRAFGGDPAVLGKTVRVNGRPFTVVGVTSRGYFGVSNGGFFPPTDVTVPLSAQPLVSPRWTPKDGSIYAADNVYWLRLMARIHDDSDRPAVQAALTTAFAQQVAASGAQVDASNLPAITLVDGSRGLDSMRPALEKPLLMLGAVAGIVFLIACVNIASMVLARGVARQQEFWIRLALGAGRARLIRQTLVESLLLAAAGGALAIAVAFWAARAMIVTLAGATPHALDVPLDWSLMGMAAAVSMAAALFFGTFPALRLAARDNADLMRQTGAGAAAPRLRAGRALVLVQVAITVPLVVGAALFLRTVYNLAGVELGFEPRNVIVFKMDPTLSGKDEARSREMFDRVLWRVASVRGVRSATLLENSLISGWVSNTRFAVEQSGVAPKSMLMNRVGPGFFETIGLPLVAGRGIGAQDSGSAPPVAVINQAGAKTFFGATNPIGRRITMKSLGTTTFEIVGVAKDSKYDSLKKNPQAIIFLPYFQSSGLSAMYVAVRTDDSAGTGERIRAAVAEVERDVPVTDLKSQTQQIDETIGNERALTMLLVFFGVFALLLACIGLHGVTAYAVARRTSEIGIRVALGASRASVLWLILRQVVVLTIGGLVVGVPVAAVASRAARALLFGVTPADPWSMAVGALVLFVVAIGAGVVPARRAAGLDPLVALRRE